MTLGKKTSEKEDPLLVLENIKKYYPVQKKHYRSGLCWRN